MTRLLYREDAYRRECNARVLSVSGFLVTVDETVFYARAGGQPGDRGTLVKDGIELAIKETRYDRDSGSVVHEFEDPVEDSLAEGDNVRLILDWERRYRIMRMHTSLHLLCAAVNAPVTGGNMRENGTGRIDFDLPEVPDRNLIESRLNQWCSQGIAVSERIVDEKELDRNPALVRTVAVRPPRGIGKARLVVIPDVDLQACGGTHVASTVEIGGLCVTDMSKKGKNNRRIEIALRELP